MESVLKLLVASGNTKAVAPSVFKRSDTRETRETETELESVSTDEGDMFGAFLDMIQVLHLEDTAMDACDAVAVPPPAPSEVQRAPTKSFAVPPLPSLVSSDSDVVDVDALPKYSTTEVLPEFPRRLHNDRGQKERRRRHISRHIRRDASDASDSQAQTPEYSMTEELPEFSRLLHNDRGQRDRRRRIRHVMEVAE